MTEKLTIYTNSKNGKWEQVLTTTETSYIFRDLVDDFLSREHKSPSYKSMRDVQNYDGTRTITFYFDMVKKVYIIKD